MSTGRYASSSHWALSQLGVVAHRYMVDVQVTSQTLYLCNGYHALYNPANAQTYMPLGINQFAGIDAIREVNDPFPQSPKLWITAVDSASMYDPINENLFNKPLTIYDAFVDPEAFTVVYTPEPVYTGKIDEVELFFNDSKRGTYYELTPQTELRREPPTAFFDQATLWQTYSGDTFCSRMHLVPTAKSLWGQQATQFASQVTAFPLNPYGPNLPGNYNKP